MIALAVWIALVAQDAAEKPTLSPMFGSFVLAAGDVDGDGKDDFVIGDEGWEPSGSPAAFWVLSGATGREIHAFHAPDLGRDFPHRVLAAGDVDEDRHADLWLVLPPREERGDLRVELWSGKARAIARSASDEQHSSVLKLAHDGRPFGDLDGDGVGDRWNVADSRTIIASGRTGAALVNFDAAFEMVAALQDLDGDGLPELLCADSRSGIAEGHVELRSSRDSRSLWRATDCDQSWHFGATLDPIGDLDGDAVRDWLVGTDHGMSHQHGVAYVHSGSDGRRLAEFRRFGRAVIRGGTLYHRTVGPK